MVNPMRKITVNIVVDIGCLVTFIPSLISGLVLFLILPSGSGRGPGPGVYLGITRDQWLNLHDVTSLLFVALVIIHMVLHWTYFRNIRKCFRSKQNTGM
jgi:hypothetical protein